MIHPVDLWDIYLIHIYIYIYMYMIYNDDYFFKKYIYILIYKYLIFLEEIKIV